MVPSPTVRGTSFAKFFPTTLPVSGLVNSRKVNRAWVLPVLIGAGRPGFRHSWDDGKVQNPGFDPSARHSGMNLWLNGVQVASGLTVNRNQTISPSFTANSVNGQISLRIAVDPKANDFALDAVQITPSSNVAPLLANAGVDVTGN